MNKIIGLFLLVIACAPAQSQVKVITVKGIAGTYSEGLSFPIIRSDNRQVAEKINGLLQSEVLMNEKVLANPKELFRNAAFISEPDSIAQSGLTDMGFTVLMNNAQILSLKFDAEGMGAHPSTFNLYYSFNLQTGAPITASDLFTPQGLDDLRSVLKSERATLIAENWKEIEPDPEDTAYLRETFEECTQIRLGPARLTHCMRWLGFAKRCMEIAQEYVGRREGFGIKLADRESVQIKLGEIAHQIQIGRLLTMHAAWKLDRGSRARKEVSMAKVQVADTLHNAADVAIQLNGARGYSKDTILEWIYRYGRSARLVDGASEVHKMVLARFMREEGRDFWRWG